jgi:hypothetical protein
MHRLDASERQAMLLAPGEEITNGPCVCLAGVGVADGGGKNSMNRLPAFSPVSAMMARTMVPPFVTGPLTSGALTSSVFMWTSLSVKLSHNPLCYSFRLEGQSAILGWGGD